MIVLKRVLFYFRMFYRRDRSWQDPLVCQVTCYTRWALDRVNLSAGEKAGLDVLLLYGCQKFSLDHPADFRLSLSRRHLPNPSTPLGIGTFNLSRDFTAHSSSLGCAPSGPEVAVSPNSWWILNKFLRVTAATFSLLFCMTKHKHPALIFQV